jgi:hypothetical protein
MGIKHLREENGSGLVLTLMVLLVLSVLGISIGTLTLGSYRLGDANRDGTSAYYVAEAGAVAAYEAIQSEVLNAYAEYKTEESFYERVSTIMSSKNGPAGVTFRDQFGSTPTATIKVDPETKTVPEGPRKYTISSTGEVDGKKRTVTKEFTVNWIEKNTGGGGLPILADNATLLTEDSIKISNGTFQGDIYTNATLPNSITISGGPTITQTTLYYSSKANVDKLVEGSKKDLLSNRIANGNSVDFTAYTKILGEINAPTITRILPSKIFNGHQVQDDKGNLNIQGSYELFLESDVYIPIITSTWNQVFTINTQGQNRTILVDKMVIDSSNLIITGGGTLTIFVRDELDISHLPNFNNNKNSVPLNLIFLGTDNNKFKLSDWSATINGNIIVKNNIDIFANSLSIKGIFLTASKSVQLTGGNAVSNMMLIAPSAEVSLQGSYSINGTVIAKQFSMNGGTSLTYKDIDTTGFPFGGSSVPAVDPKPEDIIIAGPIIEK